MLPVLAFLMSLGLAAALPPQQPLIAPHAHVGDAQFAASTDSAKANAHYIFNAIHASLRQWDSSLQHNGMSFFPATVPKGTLLYHGTHTAERVKGMEWLAFELEHAENFARARGPPPRKGPYGPGDGPPDEPGHHPGGPPGPGNGPPGGPGHHPGGPPGRTRFSASDSSLLSYEGYDDVKASTQEEVVRGYLHIYQANRDLSRLLYIDGMSAGKTSLGTLDSTDYVLINMTSDDVQFDWTRAVDLCKLGKDWNIEGILRMEAGFEIILCDFEDGLDLISATQRPIHKDGDEEDPVGINDLELFEYLRALSIRYDGIDAERVKVDYSSMQSAYFYPINFSNPDTTADPALPRLRSAERSQLIKVKDDLKTVLSRQIAHPSINWQGVVDMIVTRYAERLQFLASDPPLPYRLVLSEINALLNSFIDYGTFSIESSITTCTEHFLRPASVFASAYTEQDNLISAAIETVTGRICGTLFDVRQVILDKPSAANVASDSGNERAESKAVIEAATLVRDLIDWLDWPVWKKCKQCDYDQVCFVAIWPWGDEEDHYSPRCKNNSEISRRVPGHQYWGWH